MPAVKKTNSNTTAFAAPFIGSYTIPSLTGNSDVYLPTNFAEEPFFLMIECLRYALLNYGCLCLFFQLINDSG